MKKQALIVGINNYNTQIHHNLVYAEQDAVEMAALLDERYGFTTKTLLGSEATFSAILNNLNKSEEADLFLFYFAGHGQEFDGIFQLYPADSALQELGALSVWALRNFLLRKNSKNIVVLDCCRNILKIAGGRGISFAVEKETGHAAVPLMDDSSLLLMMACSQGEAAYDIVEKNHGVFTWSLLEGLQGKACRDEKLTARQLFDFARGNVLQWAGERGWRQSPSLITFGACRDEDFRLL